VNCNASTYREKKSLHDSQRDTPRVQALRHAFQDHVSAGLRPLAARLKFIDESSAHLGLTRLYARAAPGQRVVEATPAYRGEHYTIVAALGLGEVSATAVLAGSMGGDAFDAYVENVLAPTLQPGDIVLWDNLNTHKSLRVHQLLTARGARLEFLPPYSPDWNPIELCWAKVKGVLRTHKARTFDELLVALDRAFAAITGSDIQAWFAHCGYLPPLTN
jgi:transposase